MNFSFAIIGLLLSFVLTQIIILVVDLWQVRLIKKSADSEASKDYHNYYELKWRINLFISIATVATIIISYFGFSFQSISSDAIRELRNKQATLDSVIQSSTDTISTLISEQEAMTQQLQNAQLSISGVQTQITSIQSKNIRKWEFHILPKVKTNINVGNRTDTIYFKNLRLVNGAPLPVFETSPIVNLIRDDKINWLFSHVATTNEYFVVQQGGDLKTDFNLTEIGIWILFQ